MMQAGRQADREDQMKVHDFFLFASYTTRVQNAHFHFTEYKFSLSAFIHLFIHSFLHTSCRRL